METAIKFIEKGAADKVIVNKYTSVPLEGKCNTIAKMVREANAYTESAI